MPANELVGRTILETPRLRLRELTLGDLNFVAELLAHPEVMRFWPKPYSRDEAEIWILRQLERYRTDGYGYWLVLDKANEQPIGQVGLLRQDFNGRTETGMGYIIHRPHWRRGYATEAAKACRDYAFTRLQKDRLVVLVRPMNLISQRLACSLGAQTGQETEFAGFVHKVFVIEQRTAVGQSYSSFSESR